MGKDAFLHKWSSITSSLRLYAEVVELRYCYSADVLRERSDDWTLAQDIVLECFAVRLVEFVHELSVLTRVVCVGHPVVEVETKNGIFVVDAVWSFAVMFLGCLSKSQPL